MGTKCATLINLSDIEVGHGFSNISNNRHQLDRLNKKQPILFITLFLLTLFLASTSSNSHAGLCLVGTVSEVGTWINPDQNTRGITKAVFNEECRDDSRTTCSGDVCSTTSGVKLVYTAEIWGACHPDDCYWGKIDGVYTTANWLRFRYEFTFAEKMVWAQIWSGGDNWLRLIVDTDFDSPLRTDYRFDAWMQRY
ncbi:MAG: hypothetical protein H6936_09980 [Burkholderiales bacterium]|nr:hypothetical protein [Nitrosomonas sp.]MCP5273980.1 hypothetical protein [Burkholderiales bacterium]MCP5275159.1 hypothetical protein [Burkholderiales bacterium]